MSSPLMVVTNLLVLCLSGKSAGAEEIGVHLKKKEVIVSVPMIVKLSLTTQKKKNFYTTLLPVGGPKKQNFSVAFDLGGGISMLPSKDCQASACLGKKRYNKFDSNLAEDILKNGRRVVPGKAKLISPRNKGFLAREEQTLQFVSLDLGDGSASGSFVKDKVCMEQANESRCFSLAFLDAWEMSKHPFEDEPYDGIVGLGPGSWGASRDFDFLHGLLRAIPRSTQGMFGLYLGNGTGGEIAFGGYDSTRLLTPISWTPVADVSDGQWQVVISAIRVGNSTLDACTGSRCLAVLDYGTSILGVPSDLESDLEDQISAAFPQNCDRSTIPDLTLELNGITLTVPVEDYSPSRGHQHNDPCLPDLVVHGMDKWSNSGKKHFLLGESILRRYYTVYDRDTLRVGFSKVKDDDEMLVMEGGSDKKEDDVVLMFQVKVTVTMTTEPSSWVLEDLDSNSL